MAWAPRPFHRKAGRQRAAHGGHERAHGHESSNRAGLASQPPWIEIHAALEEDHGDAEFDDGEEALAQRARLDHAEHVGTEQHTRHEQRQDRGNAQMVRDELAGDAGPDREREDGHDARTMDFHVARILMEEASDARGIAAT